MHQAKVFSRFGALQKAVKNYTIKATPDDKSGVLQQVQLFCSIIKQCLTITSFNLLNRGICMYLFLCFFIYQGGMFVFKGKQLLYARKDEGTGDHAPLDDIFKVCCKVPVA